MTRVWGSGQLGVSVLALFAACAITHEAHAQTAPTGSAAFPPVAKPAAPAPAPAPAAPSAPPAAIPPPAPAPPPGPVAVSAPDVVRLKNGGILRGTIAELVPGDYVTIVLITGETRKIPIAEVRRAGPASAPANADPAPAPARTSADEEDEDFPSRSTKNEAQPFAVVHSAKARVRVVSTPLGNTLFRRSASAGYAGEGIVSGYDEVCTSPCEVTIPAGTHTFAVARGGKRPLQAEPLAIPAGNSTLKADVVSNTAARVGIGILGAAMIVGGVALVADSGSSDSAEPDGAKLALGTVLTGGGIGTFIGSFFIRDRVKLSVSPGWSAPPARTGSTTRASDAAFLREGPLGLTVSARF